MSPAPNAKPTKRRIAYEYRGHRATKKPPQLVKLLDRHGVTAFWLTQEQAEKLEQLWQWDACIRQVQGDGSLVD